MRYLIALLCPPLAILMCGHPFIFIFTIPLTIPFYFPGALVALLVVAAYYERHRTFYAGLEVERSVAGFDREVARHFRMAERELRQQRRDEARERARREAEAAGPRTSIVERLTLAFSHFRLASMRFGEASVKAYRDLPDWAQPISWGLAAGSVASVAFLLIVLLR